LLLQALRRAGGGRPAATPLRLVLLLARLPLPAAGRDSLRLMPLLLMVGSEPPSTQTLALLLLLPPASAARPMPLDGTVAGAGWAAAKGECSLKACAVVAVPADAAALCCWTAAMRSLSMLLLLACLCGLTAGLLAS
jgi:hypothetical protein